MTHTYHITGMTCAGCEATVTRVLSSVDGVTSVSVDRAKGSATINMSRHVPTEALKDALKDYPKYALAEAAGNQMHSMHHAPAPVFKEEEKSPWYITYKPLLLVFGFIILVTTLPGLVHGNLELQPWMHHFMAAFFLAFSFFKFLDLKGFAESYMTYDIVAKRWLAWGYIYPFVELGLGIAYLAGYYPGIAHIITLVVMSVSIVGVLKSVLNKRKIRCACLGAVFNLPMSTVTIIEDGLMIAMSGYMLVELLSR